MASKTAVRLKGFVENLLVEFPYEIIFKDWVGNEYSVGLGRRHWRNEPLRIHIKTEAAAKDLLSLRGVRFLERVLDEEVDMEGNFYLLQLVNAYAKLKLSPWDTLNILISNLSKTFLFQDTGRATANVKSHYDIPQETLNIYLDRTYMSYSCGMFENPKHLDVKELTRIGKGKEDKFDSLEKAQWRKFKDAIDFINPSKGETLLDIGCGYGGQLVVALENYPLGKAVGWTSSRNQVVEGRKPLSKFDNKRWELNEGDYRLDNRVFDHIISIGMISHVGPRGLIPYVKNVRERIKKGGRYIHHAIMTCYTKIPMDSHVGVAWSKKYVWPGFHWFTIGEHVKALEENGFEVLKVVSLTDHYEKTTAAWCERFFANKDITKKSLGEPTFRAWQIYLSGVCSGFENHDTQVYRVYCKAV